MYTSQSLVITQPLALKYSSRTQLHTTTLTYIFLHLRAISLRSHSYAFTNNLYIADCVSILILCLRLISEALMRGILITLSARRLYSPDVYTKLRVVLHTDCQYSKRLTVALAIVCIFLRRYARNNNSHTCTKCNNNMRVPERRLVHASVQRHDQTVCSGIM